MRGDIAIVEESEPGTLDGTQEMPGRVADLDGRPFDIVMGMTPGHLSQIGHVSLSALLLDALILSLGALHCFGLQPLGPFVELDEHAPGDQQRSGH